MINIISNLVGRVNSQAIAAIKILILYSYGI